MKTIVLPLITILLMMASTEAGLSAGLTCRIFNELQGHQGYISAIAFSPDGDWVASGDDLGHILIWDLGKDGELYKKIATRMGSVKALVFSFRGESLFAGGNDGIGLWDLASGKKIKGYPFRQGVHSMNLSPDGRTLIVGGDKGMITAWDVKTGRELRNYKKAHKKTVQFIGFTGEEDFRSIGEDRKMKYWELNRSEPISTGLDEYNYEVQDVSCNPTMDICAVGVIVVRMKKGYRGIKEFHNIYLKDGVSWAYAGALKGHDMRIRALAFTPQGDYLASGGKGRTVYIWDIATGRIEVDIRYGSEILALNISPDGKWLAVSGVSQMLTLYRLKGIEGMQEIPEAIISAEPDHTPGQKYAVVIGLSKFLDPNIAPLKYTVPDAEAFYQFLISAQAGFAKANIRFLTDQQATKVNIEDALKSFLPRHAGRDDTVILFFAGHGTPDTDLTGRADDGMEKYLVPFDADLKKVAATCIPMSCFSDVFSSIRSKRVIFFIDSCFSGGGAGKGDMPDVLRRTFSVQKKSLRGVTITSNFIKQLAEGPKGYGKVLITASQANEQALELPGLGHGLFTYFLLEGLSGKADNGDGYVTLKEVYDYLEERVSMRSRREGGKQTPMMAGAITGKIVLSTLGK